MGRQRRFVIDGVKLALSATRNPAAIPLADHGTDDVCDSTGVLPPPAKDDSHTIAMGVPRETYDPACAGFGCVGRQVARIGMKDPEVVLDYSMLFTTLNTWLHGEVRQPPRKV